MKPRSESRDFIRPFHPVTTAISSPIASLSIFLPFSLEFNTCMVSLIYSGLLLAFISKLFLLSSLRIIISCRSHPAFHTSYTQIQFRIELCSQKISSSILHGQSTVVDINRNWRSMRANGQRLFTSWLDRVYPFEDINKHFRCAFSLS